MTYSCFIFVTQVVSLLLEHGADPLVKSKQDKTALDLATDEAVIGVIKQAIEHKQVKEKKGDDKGGERQEREERQGGEALEPASKDSSEESKSGKRPVEGDTADVPVKKVKVTKPVAASFADDDDVEVDF